MFWEIPALSSPLDAYKVSEDIGEWIIFIEYLPARAEYVAMNFIDCGSENGYFEQK